MNCLRTLLRLATASAIVGGFLVADQGAAHAATAPVATVTSPFARRGDTAGITYTFTVTNRSTATTSIGSVRISRPSPSWSVVSCPTAPSGWTAQVNTGVSCTFTSTTGTSDNIAPGGHAVFAVRTTTAPGSTYEESHWALSVDTNSQTFGAGTVSAAPGFLSSWISVFAITDLVIAPSATVGSACPTPQRTAAVLEERSVVVCGRNFANTTVTPSSSPSQLGGSMIQTPGPFSTGPLGPTGPAVVLGTYNPSVMTATVGTNLTVNANLGPAGHPATEFSGYSTFAPTLRVGNKTMTEGNSGRRYGIVPITVSPAVNREISFTWHTANYSASAPTDYLAVTSGTGSLSRMSTSGGVAVAVNGDTLRESEERFRVVLDSAPGTTITTRQGDVTIPDDDVPTASINDAAVAEEAGAARFIVSLDRTVPTDTTVSFETRPTGALFGAGSLTDYTGVQRSVVIPANTLYVPVDVPIRSDSIEEVDEPFFGLISASSVQAKIGDRSGTATIFDNDADGRTTEILSGASDDWWVGGCPGVTASAVEGNSVSFKVAISGQHRNPIEVYYETFSSTASHPSDFVRRVSSVVVGPYTAAWGTSPPSSAVITLATTADSTPEPTERFLVDARAHNAVNPCPSGYGIPAQIEIVDND